MQTRVLEFCFPEITVDMEQYRSALEIKNHLQVKKSMNQLDSKTIRYRLCAHKNRYLYAKCSAKGCPAVLRYRMTETGLYHLYAAVTTHRHNLISSRRLRFDAVIDYLADPPKGVPLPSMKAVVCRQFLISEKQFYYLLGRMRHQQELTFDGMIAQLQSAGYEIYVSQEERELQDPPMVAVFVSSEMKKAFHCYGSKISFDLTFNLIKECTANASRWKVGAFLGTSRTARIVPLGIVVTSSMTKEAYVQIFRMFFQAHGAQPKVVVSDQQRAIHAALKELQQNDQYTGMHFYDGYHILHNIYRRLKDKATIRHFSCLLKAKNKKEFRHSVISAEKRLKQSELPLLKHFLDHKEMYCYSQVPTSEFIGISLSSSPNQCFHSLVKRIQPSQKKYTIAIKNVLEYSHQLLQRCEEFQIQKYPYQKVYRLPELKCIRLCVSKVIFTHVLDQISASIFLELIERNSETLLVRELTKHFCVVKRLIFGDVIVDIGKKVIQCADTQLKSLFLKNSQF